MKDKIVFILLISLLLFIPLVMAAKTFYQDIKVDVDQDDSYTTWNSGDEINGASIADDTIGEDSVDFGPETGQIDYTDITTGDISTTGTVSVGAITATSLTATNTITAGAFTDSIATITGGVITATTVNATGTVTAGDIVVGTTTWSNATDTVDAGIVEIQDVGDYYNDDYAEGVFQEIADGTTLDGRYGKRSLYNGSFAERFNALATSAAGVVTMSIEKSGGGDLTLLFSDGDSTFDCTPAATITLTAGSDTSPTANYIYILKSDKILTKSASAFPTTVEHNRIGYFLVPSAAFVATNGVYVNQNWNDSLAGTDNQGHLLHMAERERRTQAQYFSGVGGNGTDGYLTPTAGNVELKATAGIIYQMHAQTVGAFDTSSGDVVLVKNWAGVEGVFHDITNLYDITTDSTGATIGNNKFFNLVVWAVGNKGGEYAPMMINLPGGFYNKQQQAEEDVSGHDDFSMSREFNFESSTGFLIARITIQMKTGGGTWIVASTTDLRGRTPDTASGGVGSIRDEFADNTFRVFDEADNTKELAFDVGAGVTAGNTRTLTPPDVDTKMWADNGSVPLTAPWDVGAYGITAQNLTATDTVTAATVEVSTALDVTGATITGLNLDEVDDGTDYFRIASAQVTTDNNVYWLSGDCTGGDIKVFVECTGEVGVGTTTPSEKLEIVADDPYILLRSGNSGYSGIKAWDNDSPAQRAMIEFRSDNFIYFFVGGNADAHQRAVLSTSVFSTTNDFSSTGTVSANDFTATDTVTTATAEVGTALVLNGTASGTGFDAFLSDATSTVINGMQTNLRLLNYANQVYRVDLNRYTDEFADESGIDTTSSTDELYDATDDFYDIATGYATEEVSLIITDLTTNEGLGNNGVGYNDKAAMSFQLSTGRDIKQIQVYLAKNSTPGEITVRIESDSPGDPSGTLADNPNGTGTIAEGSVGTVARWITCTFTNAATLASGTTYWLVLSLAGDPGFPPPRTYAAYGDADNTYADGHYEYHPNGGAWTTGTEIVDAAFKLQYLAMSATATLLSETIPATSAPDDVAVVVWAALGGSATQTVSVSRNGGSNYTEVSMTEGGTESGVIKWYWGTADISGQPSDTSLILKNVYYAGVNIYGWGVDYSDAN